MLKLRGVRMLEIEERIARNGEAYGMRDSERIMFEIYRFPDDGGEYRVVYFTELDEHNKQQAIDDAMNGEHYFDGFIWEKDRQEAKRIIEDALDQLNDGDWLDPKELQVRLEPYSP